MIRKVKSRRGSMLAELSIALSVIAVAAVTVVSFCIMLNNQVNSVKQHQAVMQELQMIRRAAEGWVEGVLAQGGEYIDQQGEKLQFSLSGQLCELFFAEGTFVGVQPEREPMSLKTDNILSVSFSSVANSQQTERLIACKVQYQTLLDHGAEYESKIYTFVIRPHIGVVYPGGGVA